MLAIKEITDKKIWEEFLDKYHVGSYPFFQTWEWGEVLEQLAVPIMKIGLFDDDRLVGVLLLVDVKAKRGHYLFLRHGPVLATPTPEYFSYILGYVKKLAGEKQASFIRISRFPQTDSISVDFLKHVGFKNSLLRITDTEICPVLDVRKSDEELLKNMRKSHRYLIRKSQTMSLEMIESTDQKDLGDFLKLLKGLSVERKFVVHKEIEEEFAVFTKYNKCLLFLAKFDNKIIAYTFIDFVGDTAYYRHAASDKAYRHIPAAYFLLWEAILETKRKGLSFFNFMGIAPESAKKTHPWYGFTMFKTGFGAENEYYFQTMDLPLNYKYWKNYMIDWVTKIKRGY